jgi:hypothetical protein
MRSATMRFEMRYNGRRVGHALAALILSGGFLAACSDITAPESNEPASVLIAPMGRVESINQEVTFSARVYDRAGRELSGAYLDWEVSRPDVLEEVSPGVFRSRGNGSAVVRVRASTGVPGVSPEDSYQSGLGPSAEFVVAVEQVPVRLDLSADLIQLWSIRQDRSLEAVVVDAMGTPMLIPPAISWMSQGAEIATVDGSGRVEAVADGTTRVVAVAGQVSGSNQVEVSATIPYVACYSIASGAGSNSQGQCAAVDIIVRELE